MEVLRYGKIAGNERPIPLAMTDSEVVNLRSGRFVSRNASTGKGEIADTTDDLIGWVEPDGASIADNYQTTDDSTLPMLIGLDSVFRLPLAYDASTYTVNYAQTIFFEECDLVVDSNVQYANPTVATNKSIIIVGGQAAAASTLSNTDGFIDAIINPNSRLDLGVGA